MSTGKSKFHLRFILLSNIYLCTDTQVSLKVLVTHTFALKLVWECRANVAQLDTKNRVLLLLVPSHTNIKENEMEDQFAKQGADMNFVGPEFFYGVNSGRKFKTGKQRNWSLWRKIPEQIKANKFINS